jgi:hypothetical protein
LSVARVLSRIEGAQPLPQFHKALRALEHYAHTLGIEGMVGKACRPTRDGVCGDQVFLKVKTEELRRLHRGTGLPDRVLRAALDRVTDGLSAADLADTTTIVDLVAEDLEEEGETRVGPELRKRIEELHRGPR